jgi:hypothetical protein
VSFAQEQHAMSCLAKRIYEVKNNRMDFDEIRYEGYVIGPSMMSRVVMFLGRMCGVPQYRIISISVPPGQF